MKKIDKGTIIIIGIIILIIWGFIHLSVSRNKTLNSDFTITKASITKVLMNFPKGKTGTQNVAQYTYKYKGVTYYKSTQIYNMKVTTGSCYEVKIANKNPEINKINLKKEIDCEE